MAQGSTGFAARHGGHDLSVVEKGVEGLNNRPAGWARYSRTDTAAHILNPSI